MKPQAPPRNQLEFVAFWGKELACGSCAHELSDNIGLQEKLKQVHEQQVRLLAEAHSLKIPGKFVGNPS